MPAKRHPPWQVPALRLLERIWYEEHFLSFMLLPCTLLYRCGVALRRWIYAAGWLRVHTVDVPVIIVGNLTVGGAGKTPLVIWLAAWLRAQGLSPGIASRGYGGKARCWPQDVREDSDSRIAGDEAVLLAQRTGCPVVAAPRRIAAVRRLVRQHRCDVVLCDDGLQHLALARDVEIIVVDGRRRYGNQRCLPCGPLREPLTRLRDVHLIVSNGGEPSAGEFTMRYRPGCAVPLPGTAGTLHPGGSNGRRRVHAIAGIGHPQRFFELLYNEGFEPLPHPFPDHYFFQEGDLHFGDDLRS